MPLIASASGTFADGTGFPSQSHLMFAANAGVWWYFTLTSASDTAGNPGTHTVKSYYSSSADLTTATWTSSTDSPNMDGDSSTLTSKLWNGKSLGCYYVNNASGTNKDIIHVSTSIWPGISPDAGNGVSYHIRAVVTATTITWGTFGSYGTASFNWGGGTDTDTKMISGNTISRTADGFIQTAASVYHSELDASVLTSAEADTADTWTAGGSGSGHVVAGAATVTAMANQTGLKVGYGISNGGSGITSNGNAKVNTIDSGTQVTASNTWLATETATVRWNNMTPGSNRATSAVLDNTMNHKCTCYAFAPLASNGMVVIYDAGNQGPPNLDNLRSTKAPQTQAQGFWPSTNTGVNAVNVFGSTSLQDSQDWSLAAVDTTHIYVTQRSSTTTLRTVVYTDTGNGSWAATTNQAPALTGKTIKAAGGVVSVTDGKDFWLFVIDSTDNAIKYVKYTVATGLWDAAWTTLVTVDSTAKYLTSYPIVANNRVGLAWQVTNGANFDTYFSSLSFPDQIGQPSRGFHPGKSAGTRGTARFYRSPGGFSNAGPQAFTQSLNATLSFIAANANRTAAIKAATLSFSTAQPKAITHGAPATLSFSGVALKQTRHALAATLSFVGGFTKQLRQLGAATLSFTGTQGRAIAKVAAATLSFTGALPRAMTIGKAATLSFVGALPKRTSHALAATLSFIGSLTASRLALVALNATLSFVGGMAKQTAHRMSATLSFSGLALRAIRKGMAATLSFVGALSTGGVLFTKALSATLSFVGSSAKQTKRSLVATLGTIGSGIGPAVVVVGNKIAIRIKGILYELLD